MNQVAFFILDVETIPGCSIPILIGYAKCYEKGMSESIGHRCLGVEEGSGSQICCSYG